MIKLSGLRGLSGTGRFVRSSYIVAGMWVGTLSREIGASDCYIEIDGTWEYVGAAPAAAAAALEVE